MGGRRRRGAIPDARSTVRSVRTGPVWGVPEEEPRTADAGLAVKALHDFAEHRHVAAFLIGTRDIPAPPSSYRPESVDEAAICADWMVDAWQDTPGAVAWLVGRELAPRGERGAVRGRSR